MTYLQYSSQETTVLILQTLSSFAAYPAGALQLLKLEDLSSLIEIAPQQPLVLEIFGLAWSTASIQRTDIEVVRANFDEVMSNLVVNFRNTDGVTLLAFIGDTFPKLNPEVFTLRPFSLRILMS